MTFGSLTDGPLNELAVGSVSIVIPAYRSARWIEQLIREVRATLVPVYGIVEIIIIDDDSPDDTWNVITAASKSLAGVHGIRLMRNEGQATATLCGIEASSGSIVVTMDDDYQHLPATIGTLVEALRSNPEIDLVFGEFPERKQRYYRTLLSRIIRMLTARSMRIPKGVKTSAFRAFRRPVADALKRQRSLNPSLSIMLLECTRRVCSVPVPHGSRLHGESNYSLRAQAGVAFDMICAASAFPLRVLFFCGFLILSSSVAAAIFYLVRALRGDIAVSGFTTLVLLQLASVGTIMFSIGLIGEYLARVLREVRLKPLFVIRASTLECESRGLS